METIIHDVKKVTVGRLRQLKTSGITSYVRDIIITSGEEQLVVIIFAEDTNSIIPEILGQGDNNDSN